MIVTFIMRRMESNDFMQTAFTFLGFKMSVTFISILLYFIFLSCLNIAAENQVNIKTIIAHITLSLNKPLRKNL